MTRETYSVCENAVPEVSLFMGSFDDCLSYIKENYGHHEIEDSDIKIAEIIVNEDNDFVEVLDLYDMPA